MKRLSEVVRPGETAVSLSKLAGKKIKDVVGHPSTEFGDDAAVFQISKIVFDDDSVLFVEGEHDCPYIPADGEMLKSGELLSLAREMDGS